MWQKENRFLSCLSMNEECPLLILSLSQKVTTPSGISSQLPPSGTDCSLGRISLWTSLWLFYVLGNILPLIGVRFHTCVCSLYLKVSPQSPFLAGLVSLPSVPPRSFHPVLWRQKQSSGQNWWVSNLFGSDPTEQGWGIRNWTGKGGKTTAAKHQVFHSCGSVVLGIDGRFF